MSPIQKAFKDKLKPYVKSLESPQVPEYHHEDERDENLEFDARNFYEENVDKREKAPLVNPEENPP